MTASLRLFGTALAGLLLALPDSTWSQVQDKSVLPNPRQRLKPEKPAGRREKLSLGALFLPAALKLEGEVPLFIHFHGGDWLPEVVWSPP